MGDKSLHSSLTNLCGEDY